MNVSRIAVVLVAVCGLAVVGCANQKTGKASAGAMNATCPISGEAVAGSTVHVAYKGQEVAFCCEGCAKKWSAMTDAQKDAKLAAAKTAK